MAEQRGTSYNNMENKYQQDNETFEQWLDRVSGSNEDVKELIRKKKFILEDESYLTEA